MRPKDNRWTPAVVSANPMVVVLIALATTHFMPSQCSGTVVRPMSPESLTKRADLVFAGTVVGTHSETFEGTIVTTVRFAQLKFAKGTGTGDSTSLVLRGGTVGGDFIAIDGQPQFDLHERYIVFTLKDRGSAANSFLPVVGLDQGCFRVLREGGSDDLAHVADMMGRPVMRLSREHVTVVSTTRGDSRRRERVHGTAKAESLFASKPQRLPEGIPEIISQGADTGARLSEGEFLRIIRGFVQ